jgi:hypothetical protein
MLRLEHLHTGDGRELPPRLKAEIARELRRLELILGMLKEIEAERDAIECRRRPSWEAKSEARAKNLLTAEASYKCHGEAVVPIFIGRGAPFVVDMQPVNHARMRETRDFTRSMKLERFSRFAFSIPYSASQNRSALGATSSRARPRIKTFRDGLPI